MLYTSQKQDNGPLTGLKTALKRIAYTSQKEGNKMNQKQIEIYKFFERRGLERSSACRDAILAAEEPVRTIHKIDLVSDSGIVFGVVEIPN